MKVSKLKILAITTMTVLTLMIESPTALAGDRVPILAFYNVVPSDPNSSTTVFNTQGPDNKSAYLDAISHDACALVNAFAIAELTKDDDIQKSIFEIRTAMKSARPGLDFDVALTYSYSKLPGDQYNLYCNWELVEKGTPHQLKDFETFSVSTQLQGPFASEPAEINCKLFSSQVAAVKTTLTTLVTQVDQFSAAAKVKQGLLDVFDQFSKTDQPSSHGIDIFAVTDHKTN